MLRGAWRRAAGAASVSGAAARFASSARPSARAQLSSDDLAKRNASMLLYAASGIISFVGLSYAAVPLYQIFCQATGFGGTPRAVHGNAPIPAAPAPDARFIKIRFNADVSQRLRWRFRPQQSEITVQVGETALAFYTAENLSDRDITGIATYNVTPNKAGQYFNKIQCFCFEYQRLRAKESVDMPIFFYVDPALATDATMMDVDAITLSYTFFEASAGDRLLSQVTKAMPAPAAASAQPTA